MSTWVDDIVTALERLNGLAPRKQIIEEVRKIRPGPYRPNIVDAIIQDHSSDSVRYKGKKDIFYSAFGIGQGWWGLRSQLPAAARANDFELAGSMEPERVRTIDNRIIRDAELVKQLKLLHAHACQLCSRVLRFPDGTTYSEGHHIRPLGRDHRGRDKADNILILCPNCHALCDYFAIRLDLATIRQLPGHSISADYIDYHNRHLRGLDYKNE
jgi:hypothetical protein